MAIADPIPEFSRPPARTGFALLVVVAPLPANRNWIACWPNWPATFPPDDLLIATQNEIGADVYLPLHLTNAPATQASWTLTAADFVNAYQLAQKHEARAILMLGPDAGLAECQRPARSGRSGSIGIH